MAKAAMQQGKNGKKKSNDASLYQNDKAVEYQSEVVATQNMIADYESENINMQGFRDELQMLQKQCSEELNPNVYDMLEYTAKQESSTQVGVESAAEMVYEKYINSLKELRAKIELVYGVYYTTSKVAKVMEQDLEKSDIDAKAITKMANSLKGYISDIIYSHTRKFEYEEELVNRLYDLAYKVMKLEFKVNNSSVIHEMTKTDAISYNYISALVRREIDGLDDTKLKKMITKIIAKQDTADYLDKGVVNILANQLTEDNIKIIKATLKNFCKDIDALQARIDEYKEKIPNLRSKCEEKQKDITTSKRKILTAVLIVGIASGAIGTIGVVATKPTFDTLSEAYNSKSEELVSEMKREKQTDEFAYVTEYTKWEVVENEFSRTITTYDASGIYYEDIVDYTKMDLSGLEVMNQDVITKDSLTVEDYLEDTIYEVERLVQSDEYDEDALQTQSLINALLYILGVNAFWCIVTVFGNDWSIISIIKEIRKKKKMQQDYSVEIAELDKMLREQAKAIKDNEDISHKFIQMYEQYREYIPKSEKLEEKYNKLTRKKDK